MQTPSFLDKLSHFMFIAGVISTLAIGLIVGFESIQKNEVKVMSGIDDMNRVIDVNIETVKRSWDGISNMKPSPPQANNSSSTQ